ncbi:hypothetical protein BE08_13140 [Sorangium cellulosum]|uniref:Uncharacterized protein n=1 Tax=Sorangium cellulosum TaxID=56 RepID=A0A150PAJ9_SORCE|nr:hypothetical protein BE08_13140 [Sorangium cellulosum]
MLTMMTGGCDPIVFHPVEPEPPEEPPPSLNAIAMRASDWMLALGGLTSSLEAAEDLLDPAPHPDSLVLFFSDSPQECSHPLNKPPTPCTADTRQYWQVILVVPPELNRPGLIDLRDRRIRIYTAEVASNCTGLLTFSAGSSSSSGGEREKTLEIVSSDASSVSVTLDWGELPLGWAHVDGDYAAMYCGAAPLVSPPSPGLALTGARGPRPPDGVEPDPDALQLILGSGAVACEDLLSRGDCSGGSRVTLSLPTSLQQPGIIDLTDPAIDASFAVSRGSAESCERYDPLTGSFDGGTVEILSIDEGGVLARVYGSYTRSGFNADGLYSASICP